MSDLLNAIRGAGVSGCLWSDILIVDNIGPAHDPRRLDGNIPSNRGFNALIVEGSRPTNFLKVRSTSSAPFRRECVAASRACEQPSTEESVPSAVTAEAGSLRLLLTEFVDGPDLTRALAGSDPPKVVDTFRAVVETTAPLWAAAEQLCDGPPEAASGLDQCLADLDYLERFGLPGRPADALRERLATATLPIRLQHGDLWPRNVVRSGSGWKILDFESFGTIGLPLYDVFHLARGLASMLPPPRAEGGWLRRWQEALPPGSNLSWIAELVDDLDGVQVEAAAAAYQVHVTAAHQRKGNRPEIVKSLIAQLAEFPRWIERGDAAVFRPR